MRQARLGVGGSMDYFGGESPHGPVTGAGVTLGAAAGASFAAAGTNTSVYDPFEATYKEARLVRLEKGQSIVANEP